MKKRLLCVVLTVLMVCCLSTVAFADQVTADTRNGVAVIVEWVNEAGNEYPYSQGSCFFVGEKGQNPKYLVTAHHVVEDYLEFGAGETVKVQNKNGVYVNVKVSLRVYFSSSDYVEAYVVDSDENQDIAILKLEKTTSKREPLPLLIPDEDMVGDSVYVIGYPGTADGYLDPASLWGSEDSLVTKGTIGRFVTISGSGTKWIQSSDISLDSGNSGGPLVTEDGNVIGIVTGTMETLAGGSTDFAANIEPVVSMLKKNSIDFEDAANAKKEAEPSVVTTPEPTPEPEPEPEPFYKSPVFLIIVALILVAAVVGIALALKKKTKEEPKEQPSTNNSNNSTGNIGHTVAVKAKPFVCSLTPQHAGQRVYLKDQPITIGRAKDCNIIFAEDTAGVSGHHCTVSWDDNTKDFVLIDIGSSYGTFLASGQKLDIKIAYHLKKDERFYLGEKANLLVVGVD